MNLMISATLLRHAPAATHPDVAVDTLSYAIGQCALGLVLAARSVDGVCALVEADLVARFPQATLVANEAVVRDDLTKVIRFVDKPAGGLHLTLDMRGTPFRRRVWEKLRAIPVGRTATYTEVGPLGQPPGLSPCDRRRLRHQSDRTGHSLPPRRPR